MMSCCQVERCRSRRRRFGGASAFTLLEVILALVILGGALAIFGEVMQLANRSAVDARAETQAQLLASSLMDEIMAGVLDESPATRQPLDVSDSTPWVYSIETPTTDAEGVYPLEVVVEQDLEPQFNPVKYRLIRWLPVAAETSENAEEADASSQQSSRQGAGGGSAGAPLGGSP
jgi:prepilin-type N-terminal cleavage/methylation domain-containing protein